MAEVIKSLLDETLVDLTRGGPQTLAMRLNYVSYRPPDAEQGASSSLLVLCSPYQSAHELEARSWSCWQYHWVHVALAEVKLDAPSTAPKICALRILPVS